MAPDTRFGLELVDCTTVFAGSAFKVFADVLAKRGIIKALVVPDGSALSRKDLDDLTAFVAIYGAKGLAWIRIGSDGWQSPIVKFLSEAERERPKQEAVVKGIVPETPAPIAAAPTPVALATPVPQAAHAPSGLWGRIVSFFTGGPAPAPVAETPVAAKAAGEKPARDEEKRGDRRRGRHDGRRDGRRDEKRGERGERAGGRDDKREERRAASATSNVVASRNRTIAATKAVRRSQGRPARRLRAAGHAASAGGRRSARRQHHPRSKSRPSN